MSTAYDKNLRRTAWEVAKELGMQKFVQEGVYCMVGGPNFETAAEARMLHALGSDAVGEILLIAHLAFLHLQELKRYLHQFRNLVW